MAVDPLQRFLDAQETHYADALEELRDGEKRTHWIWYVFPQMRGLGQSDIAQHYGIASLDEARAYYRHPVLRARLHEAAMSTGEDDPETLLGHPDDLKLRSCLTLFLEIAPEDEVLQRALDHFYDGSPDEETLDMIGG